MTNEHRKAVVMSSIPSGVRDAINALQCLGSEPPGTVHREAESILLQLVDQLGFFDVVQEYQAALDRAPKIN
jgi:hypothetical protein